MFFQISNSVAFHNLYFQMTNSVKFHNIFFQISDSVFQIFNIYKSILELDISYFHEDAPRRINFQSERKFM
jgi:hypothetical protein